MKFIVSRVIQEFEVAPAAPGQPPARLPVWRLVFEPLPGQGAQGQLVVRYAEAPPFAHGQEVEVRIGA